MLDPRDQAFLRAAVRGGHLPAAAAQELAARYHGEPGGLGRALVGTGRLRPEVLRAIEAEQSSGSGSGGGPHLESTAAGSRRFGPEGATPGPSGSAQQSARALDSGHVLSADPSDLGTVSYAPGASEAWASADAAPQPESGRIRLHRYPTVPGYRVVEELGRGGMGAVYKAVHERTGREVALKVLLKASELHQKRFEREVQALRRLRHPNVVELITAGETGEGAERQPYLVMAFHPGGDLRGALEEGTLDPDQALGAIAKVARALDYAHGEEVLHRDLKPANILLDAAGEPYVTDFGLAKILDRETRLTKTNATIGTPYYMAPEQVRGEEYTPAVEVYALGVILNEVVTGKLPYGGSERSALFQAIQRERPDEPWVVRPGVSRELGRVVLWALEKHPADRPSCIQLAEAIETFLAGSAVRITPPSTRRRRLRRAGVALAGLLFVASLGVALAGFARWRARLAAERANQAALHELREAIAATSRRRREGDLDGLLREVEAHRRVAAAIEAAPAAVRQQAEALGAASRERRAQTLASAIERLAREGRVEQAIALAGELVAFAPTPAHRVLEARVLAARPASAAAAFARAEALLREPPAEPAARGALAEVLLTLQRPREAAGLLVGDELAAPLLAARARAHEARGALAAALDDLRAASAADPAQVEVAAARWRLEVELGARPAGEALAALEALSGGSLPEWQRARGLLLERTGRLAASRAALAEAAALAPANALELARWLARRGRRVQALAALAGIETPAARLERVVAGWVGGEESDPALAALHELEAGQAAFETPLVTAAAAARWAAWVEASRGRWSEARAAAERAAALEPGPASATLLAFTRCEAGDPVGALEALTALGEPPPAATQRVALTRAHALLARGEVAAARVAAQAAPAHHPERATVELAAARAGGAPAERLGELEREAYTWWRVGPGDGPPPAPVAGAPLGTSRRALVDRLYHEALVLEVAARAREEGAALRRERLLLRAVTLAPDHLPARIALAEATRDLAALDELIARRPVPELHRARLDLRVRLAHEGRGKLEFAEAEPDFAALLAADALEPAEQAMYATLLLRTGRVDEAWRAVRPLCDALPRRRDALRLAIELAERRGDAGQAQLLGRRLAETEELFSRADALLVQANRNQELHQQSAAKAAVRQLERILPPGPALLRVQAEVLCGDGMFGPALLVGGRYVLAAKSMSATGLSLWLHAFGWAPQMPQRLVSELTAEARAKDARDPVPDLALALHYGARYYLRPIAERKPSDPEDVELAAQRALRGVHLAPRSPTALALAANLLVSARDGAEGLRFVDLALTAEPNQRFAYFQRVRHLAGEGAVDAAMAALEGRSDLGLNGPSVRRQVLEDPMFAPILEEPAFQDYLRERGVIR